MESEPIEQAEHCVLVAQAEQAEQAEQEGSIFSLALELFQSLLLWLDTRNRLRLGETCQQYLQWVHDYHGSTDFARRLVIEARLCISNQLVAEHQSCIWVAGPKLGRSALIEAIVTHHLDLDAAYLGGRRPCVGLWKLRDMLTYLACVAPELSEIWPDASTAIWLSSRHMVGHRSPFKFLFDPPAKGQTREESQSRHICDLADLAVKCAGKWGTAYGAVLRTLSEVDVKQRRDMVSMTFTLLNLVLADATTVEELCLGFESVLTFGQLLNKKTEVAAPASVVHRLIFKTLPSPNSPPEMRRYIRLLGIRVNKRDPLASFECPSVRKTADLFTQHAVQFGGAPPGTAMGFPPAVLQMAQQMMGMGGGHLGFTLGPQFGHLMLGNPDTTGGGGQGPETEDPAE